MKTKDYLRELRDLRDMLFEWKYSDKQRYGGGPETKWFKWSPAVEALEEAVKRAEKVQKFEEMMDKINRLEREHPDDLEMYANELEKGETNGD